MKKTALFISRNYFCIKYSNTKGTLEFSSLKFSLTFSISRFACMYSVFYSLIFPFKRYNFKGWRDDAAVKSPPHTDNLGWVPTPTRQQSSDNSVPGAAMPSSGPHRHCTHIVYRHRQNTKNTQTYFLKAPSTPIQGFSLCVALAGLELKEICLCLLNAGIKGTSHHCLTKKAFK